MSLRERTPSLVKRVTITLPDRGEDVVVRGLFLGKSRELGDVKDNRLAGLRTLACTLEDVGTGVLLFDEHNDADLEWIDANFTIDDTTLCVNTVAEMSGVRKPEKAVSSGDGLPGSTETAITSSPSSSSPKESEDGQ